MQLATAGGLNVPPERWCNNQKSDVRGCEDQSVSQSRLAPDMLAIGHLPKLDLHLRVDHSRTSPIRGGVPVLQSHLSKMAVPASSAD